MFPVVTALISNQLTSISYMDKFPTIIISAMGAGQETTK